MRPRAAGNPPQRMHGQRWGTGDRGSASLELVIVFPVLLLLIFGGVQGALYYYGRSIALAAAQEGSRAAAAQNGSTGAGHTAATTFITQAGGTDVLQGPQISSSRSATDATVTVHGSSLSILPFWGGLTITQSASTPLERLTG
jgi:Flp pilus assembly protein TadG